MGNKIKFCQLKRKIRVFLVAAKICFYIYKICLSQMPITLLMKFEF